MIFDALSRDRIFISLVQGLYFQKSCPGTVFSARPGTCVDSHTNCLSRAPLFSFRAARPHSFHIRK